MDEEREIVSFTAAMVLLDEYIEAYKELQVEHARLELRYRNACEQLLHARGAIDNELWLADRMSAA